MITSSLNALPPMLTADSHSTSSSNTFLAIPRTDSCHPEIGVGYVGATHSTYQEILEEALYLADLLSIRVLGVIPSSFCRVSTKRASEQTVKALFSIWSSFLSENPSSKFVQYFFGNGVYLIEEALSLFAPPPHCNLLYLLELTRIKNHLSPVSLSNLASTRAGPDDLVTFYCYRQALIPKEFFVKDLMT